MSRLRVGSIIGAIAGAFSQPAQAPRKLVAGDATTGPDDRVEGRTSVVEIRPSRTERIFARGPQTKHEAQLANQARKRKARNRARAVLQAASRRANRRLS